MSTFRVWVKTLVVICAFNFGDNSHQVVIAVQSHDLSNPSPIALRHSCCNDKVLVRGGASTREGRTAFDQKNEPEVIRRGVFVECKILRCTLLLCSELRTKSLCSVTFLVLGCYSPYALGHERKGIMRKHARAGALLVDATAALGRRAFLLTSPIPNQLGISRALWTIRFVIRAGQVCTSCIEVYCTVGRLSYASKYETKFARRYTHPTHDRVGSRRW